MCLPSGMLLADSDFCLQSADRDVAGCAEVEMFSQPCSSFSASVILDCGLVTVSLQNLLGTLLAPPG